MRRLSIKYKIFLGFFLIVLLALSGCFGGGGADAQTAVCNKIKAYTNSDSGTLCVEKITELLSAEIANPPAGTESIMSQISTAKRDNAIIEYKCSYGWGGNATLTANIKEKCNGLYETCRQASPSSAQCQDPECTENTHCPNPDDCHKGICSEGVCGSESKCPEAYYSTCSAGNCIADCGNGYCQEGENYLSCPGDCPNTEECILPSGQRGITGEDAVPKVLLYWDWGDQTGELTINACENNYCDPVQFTITLMKRLQGINSRMKQDRDYSDLASFNAFLIKDSYTPTFFSDFKEYAENQAFFEIPGWFTSQSTPFIEYLEAERLEFSPVIMETSGLYSIEVEIELINPAEQELFKDGTPNADITIHLYELTETQNQFYYLPINGQIGADNGRQDYGVKFTYDGEEPLQTTDSIDTMTIESSNGKQQTIITIEDSFEALNTGITRGQVFELSNNAQSIILSKNTPVTVLGVTEEELAYKLLKNGINFQPSSSNGTSWEAFASESCLDSQGNQMPYYFEDYKSGSCFTVAETEATEFYRTVFYKPKNTDITLLVCEGSFAKSSDILIPKNQTLAIEDNSTAKQITSLQKIFDLIEQQKICVVEEEEITRLYWNEREFAEEANDFYSSTPPNCEVNEPAVNFPECNFDAPYYCTEDSCITDFIGEEEDIEQVYDTEGRIAEVNKGRSSIVYEYAGDNLDKETNTIDRKSFVTDYGYDSDGYVNAILTINENGTEAINEIGYKYDSEKRVKEETINGETTYYNYYTTGGQDSIAVNHPDGTRETYAFDSDGRVTEYNRGAPDAVYYTYKPEGEIGSVRDRQGNSADYYYNDIGEIQDIIDNDFFGRDYSFEYDAQGNLEHDSENEMTYDYYPNGTLLSDNFFTYTYNDALEVKTATNKESGETTRYYYDQACNLTNIAYPDGTMEEFYYNGNLDAVRYIDRENNLYYLAVPGDWETAVSG